MSAAPVAAGIRQLGQHALLLCSHPHQALLLHKQPAGTTGCTVSHDGLRPRRSAAQATSDSNPVHQRWCCSHLRTHQAPDPQVTCLAPAASPSAVAAALAACAAAPV